MKHLILDSLLEVRMIRRVFLTLTALLYTAATYAQGLEPLYKKSDSIKVEQLLREGARQPSGTNLPLFYAKKFLGVPYVAATLEVSECERLVVNLQQLDCTTLVEVATALTLTQRQGRTDFRSFCRQLQNLRYKGGVIQDYTSRNHYFSSAILNAEQMGLAHEIKPADCGKDSPFTGKQSLNIYFMSHNPERYSALKKNSVLIPAIQETEKKLTGVEVSYIPTKMLGKSKALRQTVHDGDILAIVTKREGLDIAHVGFAVWGKDGCLHLLNASSLHRKVVIETKTLQRYLQGQRLRPGVRVIRIKGSR